MVQMNWKKRQRPCINYTCKKTIRWEENDWTMETRTKEPFYMTDNIPCCVDCLDQVRKENKSQWGHDFKKIELILKCQI